MLLAAILAAAVSASHDEASDVLAAASCAAILELHTYGPNAARNAKAAERWRNRLRGLAREPQLSGAAVHEADKLTPQYRTLMFADTKTFDALTEACARK